MRTTWKRTSTCFIRHLTVLFFLLGIGATPERLRASESRPVMSLESAYQSNLEFIQHYLVSPNGRRFACAAEQNGQWHLLLDGKAFGPYDKMLNPTSPYAFGLFWSFSSDSKHFAACLRHQGQDYLFVDGHMGPGCEQVDAGKFDYSPQNESFACEAKQNGRWGWLVRKSNQAKFFTKQAGDDDLLSGGGQQLYGMHIPASKGRNQIGGAYTTRYDPYDPYFNIKTKDKLFLSGNHQHTYYLKSIPRQGTGVVIDGKLVNTYSGIRSFWFTQDGHYCYIGSLKKSKPRNPQIIECVVDGKVVVSTDIKKSGIGSIHLSPDGQRYAYVSKNKGTGYIICEGKKFGPFMMGYRPSYGFGPKGKHFWILAYQGDNRNKKQSFIYDGQEQSFIPYGNTAPTFSPDGTRFAFRSLAPGFGEKRINPERGYVMVIDDKPSSVYSGLGKPVFSPDSKHLAFWAGKGTHRSVDKFLVLDGREIPVGRQIMLDSCPILFSPNSEDLWYSSTGSDAYLVRNHQIVCRYEHMPLQLCNFTADNKHLVYSDSSSPKQLWIDGAQIPCPAGSFRMPRGLGKQIALTQTNKDALSMFVFTSDHLDRATIDLTELNKIQAMQPTNEGIQPDSRTRVGGRFGTGRRGGF